MALKYAILEVLSDGPNHGYAVHAELTARIGGFWPLDKGQVYATLDRQARAGLVEMSEDRTATDPAGRKWYVISNRGRRALDAWRSDPDTERPNDGLGFDDWFAHLAVAHRFQEPHLVRRTIDVQRRRCRALLQALEQSEKSPGSGDAATRVARGILAAELDWLEIAERELLPDTTPTAPPA